MLICAGLVTLHEVREVQATPQPGQGHKGLQTGTAGALVPVWTWFYLL